ncbi:FG-GAP-like repeat-containing protein [Argonema antarcticum]|uniref:FG-GAP-like repeat-containing protein n=1 Tax=Argonema antarcticum TaxID=2942763 RepID=UPI00308412DC
MEGYWNSWKLNIYGTEPTVNVMAADANAAESGNDTGKFTFTRTGSNNDNLIVNYSVAGTATKGADYNAFITGTITIPAGQDSASISITPIDDVLFEKDETVTVHIDSVTGYNIGTKNNATVVIAENDTLPEAFTDIGAAFTGDGNSSPDWGDYDNDGDLDILLAGSGNSKVYRNDNGNFTDLGASLTGVSSGSVDWGDYDNDGDIDILLTGSGNSKVYRNDNGNFNDIGASLTGVSYSSAAWGDYDNDGDLDILLTGTDSSDNKIAKVYRNDKGSFTNIGASIAGVRRGSVAWGDYDNDGDLDILLTGESQLNGEISRIYRNDGGSFTDVNAPLIGSLTGVRFGSAVWGDYDNDGDLDILLTGTDRDEETVSKVYRNDGGSFTDINAALKNVGNSSAAWGDYDNDGDLDILLTGVSFDNSVQRFSQVYRNDAGNFIDIGAGLISVERGSAAWGDYDNDGNLDIVLTGWSSSDSVAKVYKNNTVKLNTIPTVPTDLNASVNGNSINLKWNPSTDTQTPLKGLTYNLRVGTTPGGSEIISPIASGDGTRKVAQMGSVNQNTDWTLNYLAPGTYYWSVQAVDNTFGGSPFAKEGNFRVDRQPKTLLSIGAVQAVIPEVDRSSGQFLITRRGDTTTPLSVNYTVGGTATNGTDYQPLGGKIIIPAGSATATIPINIIDDTVFEGGEETVVINLNPDTAYDLGSPSSSTMTIYDGAIAILQGSVIPE